MSPEIQKLLEDIAAHLKEHDGFHMESVDYPGYPDRREGQAQNLYHRINQELRKGGNEN